MSRLNRCVNGFAALLSAAAVATAQPTRECGTVLTPEAAAVVAELQRRGFYDLPADFQIESFVPRVPVTLHVVRRSDETGGISAAVATAHFNEARGYWDAMGIDLFQAGNVRFIDDTGLFDVESEAELLAVWSTDVVPNTVNVYFVNSISLIIGGDACGIGTFSAFGPVQGVIVNATDCTNQTQNSTLAHEIGHYFDLLHTHETFYGAECPDGSNCASAGDLVCDTPADPDLSLPSNMDHSSPTCTYIGTQSRCGVPFSPDTGNVMSYASPRTCRDTFSTGQRNRALATLINLRSSLIESGQPSTIWVDFDAGTLFPNGNFTDPYVTLTDALNAVSPGGQVVIKAGVTDATGEFSQPAVIDAFMGSAVIGQ